MTKINFADSLDDLCKIDCFCATISVEISSKNELFDEFRKKLNFPNDFGFNWDALYDFLVDLSWVSEKMIFVIFEFVPKLSTNDLKILIDIINDTTTFWEKYEDHKIKYFFPNNAVDFFDAIV